ncbi:hypothetical protein ACM74C_08045 [Pseudomonas aeruginosa]|nr:hypothetical protein [Pseudomonas aeruginosa]
MADTWAPVTMRWPAQATQWLDELTAAKNLASGELTSTGLRLTGLDGLATTSPGPVAAAAQSAIANGRAALTGQLGQAPDCLVVTPFQSGIGRGTGHQRYLSAPTMLQHLAGKLLDTADSARPSGTQYALVLMFLATRYDELASTLARFNALLPVSDLVRAERRARHLSRLEKEKWEIPSAGPLPRWSALPLERCTVTKAARQSLAGQLAVLEGYAADSSPLGDLSALAARKVAQQQARDQQLADLQALLAGGSEDITMRARLIGPVDPGQLRTALLDGSGPGHEWVLSAGVILVGSLDSLSFVRELVGL